MSWDLGLRWMDGWDGWYGWYGKGRHGWGGSEASKEYNDRVRRYAVLYVHRRVSIVENCGEGKDEWKGVDAHQPWIGRKVPGGNSFGV